ncbi:MCE family protein [Williamsia maris]|uniref:Phospholipid/cholesterol/gamma-HCH transport system substrate-binding protein n=2 Tax=Williamsia maris TaxID=72806 RepID=A0ABT1HF53_9NOCA|nr:phospholipid/cholesterol/gamma-HCH transport system substrate-binding protein [Williamsia maris]
MTRYRLKLYALALITAIVAVVTVAALSFNGTFTSTIPVTVVATRAGLLTDPGAKVKFRGLDVGRVRTITATGDTARIVIAVDSDAAAHIPANASIAITSSTVFGAKYINFDEPRVPESRPIAPDTVLNTDDVTVETNTTFERLTSVLRQIEPDKLNTITGALSQALGNGRGASLGTAITELEKVVGTVNSATPQLRQDITAGTETIEAFADAAPDIMSVLTNLPTTAKTITDKRSTIDLVLTNVLGFADTGTDVLKTNSSALATTLETLSPTTDLLRVYAPELKCLVTGLDESNKLAGPAFAGTHPGATLSVGFVAGSSLYGQQNLPKVNATGGPRCFGLPLIDPTKNAPYLVTDTGVNPYKNEPKSLQFKPEDLFTSLLGQPRGQTP